MVLARTKVVKPQAKIFQIYKCALKDKDTMASQEKDSHYVIAAFFQGCGGRPITWELVKS